MKVNQRKWFFVITLLVTVGLLAACGGAETSQPTEPPQVEEPTEIPEVEEPTEIPDVVEPTNPPPSIDGEALLQERCTVCHSLDRVMSKSWSLQQWERNVSEMINKGARLDAEEKDALVKYLAENYGP